MTPLADRLAVVTGASRGIGHAVAASLERAGARIIGLARSFPPWPEHVPAGTVNAQCDVTSPADVTTAAGRIVEAAGPPDLLVHAAGGFMLGALAETRPEDFEGQLRTNLLAPFLVLRAFLPPMGSVGSGHVIMIGSVVDHQAFPGNAAYAASKWGARGLHEVARAEAAAEGIRFTLLSPGATDTGLWDAIDPDRRADLPSRHAMLRPDEVAEAVLFAATRPSGVNVDLMRISSARRG